MIFALTSPVFSNAAHRNWWSVFHGWRCGSFTWNLWPGWAIRGNGFHRWMPCHWFPGSSGQVVKMLVNLKFCVCCLLFRCWVLFCFVFTFLFHCLTSPAAFFNTHRIYSVQLCSQFSRGVPLFCMCVHLFLSGMYWFWYFVIHRGTDELLGVMDRVHIINSTLGKALGGAAGM